MDIRDGSPFLRTSYSSSFWPDPVFLASLQGCDEKVGARIVFIWHLVSHVTIKLHVASLFFRSNASKTFEESEHFTFVSRMDSWEKRHSGLKIIWFLWLNETTEPTGKMFSWAWSIEWCTLIHFLNIKKNETSFFTLSLWKLFLRLGLMGLVRDLGANNSCAEFCRLPRKQPCGNHWYVQVGWPWQSEVYQVYW